MALRVSGMLCFILTIYVGVQMSTAATGTDQQRLTIFQRDLSAEMSGCEYFTNNKQLSSKRHLSDYSKQTCYPPEQTYSKMNMEYSKMLRLCGAATRLRKDVLEFTGRASWVDSFSHRDAYIASESPLDDGQVRRFWDMVWHNNVRVIVMLTRTIEDFQFKSAQYWPNTVTEIKIIPDAYKITALFEKDARQAYGAVCMQLRVHKLPENALGRQVTHCLFTEWPDMKLPLDSGRLLEFRKRVSLLNNVYTNMSPTSPEGQPPPILVHCMAGLGRTGTYIAIDVLIDRMEKEAGRPVDVAGVVLRLRLQRPQAVLNKEQYMYCASALRAHRLSVQ